MSQASASESTDELAKLVMPDAPQDLKKGSPIGLMKYLGPGLIMASASIGSGEIFFASRGGAVFGYVLLWTFVAAAILKGIAVYSGTRYITITGESPFARFGQVIPGPKNWFPVLLGILAVVSFPSWAGGFASFLGQWSVWTFGFGNPQIWASVWILLAFATLFFAGYSYVEKFQTGVVLLLIVFVFVAVIVANPNYFEVLRGLIPTIPAEHALWVVEKYPEVAARPISLEVISYLGAIGGGTYDYIGYVGMYNEKKWGMLGAPNLEEINAKLIKLKAGERFPIDESEQNTENVRAWAKAPLTDTLISFVAVLIFSAAFMILGNVILGADGTQEIPNDRQIMQFQAQFFDQISPALVYFYQLAVWAAFFGSMQASGTMMYAHTFYQCFAPAVRWVRETNFFNVRLLVALIYSGGGLILVWTGLSFTTLVSFGALVGGVLSIGLWALAMLYTDSKFLPKKFQMATGTQILLGIAGGVLTGMGVVAILQFFNII
ncbi:MAG: Nramp family divalent metal transporter [Acidobacteriota bacterium]|nr:Nramp family divalent metal transporter [Acidobacteriota bacterium]